MGAHDTSRTNAIGDRPTPNLKHNCDQDPPEWLADELLDDDDRTALGQISSPRLGLDGRLYWPVEETRSVHHD